MPLTYDEAQIAHRMRDRRRTESEAEMRAIFTLAGFVVSQVWELYNRYWPDTPEYDAVRSPWWLMQTEIGPVQIGWRKRVINIRWDGCKFRGEVTSDDVTKSDVMVHAWSSSEAVKYLTALRLAALRAGDAKELS